MAIDLDYFKTKLEQEKKSLEVDLSRIARVNPGDPADWEMKPTGDTELAFHDEVPELLAEEGERAATEAELEQPLREINLALERLAVGAYGQCAVCDQPIELERLEANPAARTCKQHLNS